MYAIIGITGKVGSAVAENLLKKNLPVKAILRNHAKAGYWEHKGAKIAIADLKDENALTKAFEKTAGVFLMTPPLWDSNDPMREHDQMLHALTLAIAKTKPGKVVFLSSVGGHLATGTGAIRKLYDLENTLAELNIPTVGIRAAWFMENYTGSLGQAEDSGILSSFLVRTDERIPMIAIADIGSLASELLQENWTGHRIIELEGPARYAPADVARLLSDAVQKEILTEAIPDKDFESTYLSYGFTMEGSLAMSEMIRGFNRGTLVFEENGIEHAKGDTTLKQVLNPFLI